MSILASFCRILPQLLLPPVLQAELKESDVSRVRNASPSSDFGISSVVLTAADGDDLLVSLPSEQVEAQALEFLGFDTFVESPKNLIECAHLGRLYAVVRREFFWDALGNAWGYNLLAFGFEGCKVQIQPQKEYEAVFAFLHAIGGADGGVEGVLGVAEAVGAGGFEGAIEVAQRPAVGGHDLAAQGT
jgi:hypothetical protein